ncbi:unnamed protein product [Cuscuta europaea]|uniref:Uncharacterized protein n=1 Tax=Cuscuta europaea TaxID=41803 RepID=A0A9P0ZBP7_CUSEU|nr:unnamed protein product [Cuscuta europaea]
MTKNHPLTQSGRNRVSKTYLYHFTRTKNKEEEASKKREERIGKKEENLEKIKGILPRYSRLLKESKIGRKSRQSRRSFRRKISKVTRVQTKRLKAC